MSTSNPIQNFMRSRLSSLDKEHLPDFSTKTPEQEIMYVSGDESLYLHLMPNGEIPQGQKRTRELASALSSLDSKNPFVYVFQTHVEQGGTNNPNSLGVGNLVRILFDEKQFDTAAALEHGLGSPGDSTFELDQYLRLAEPFFRIVHHPLDRETSQYINQKRYGLTILLVGYSNWKWCNDNRAELFLNKITGGIVSSERYSAGDTSSKINGYWADFQHRLIDTESLEISYPVSIVGNPQTVDTLTKLVHLAGFVQEMHGFTSDEAQLLYTARNAWRQDLPEGAIYNPSMINLNSPEIVSEAINQARSQGMITDLRYILRQGIAQEELRKGRSMD